MSNSYSKTKKANQAKANPLKLISSVAFKRLGKILFKTNSTRYWDYRLRLNWASAGGKVQTQDFAKSLLKNLNLGEIEFSSVLDYGCALGDSVPIFRRFRPEIEIHLWDISQAGLKIATKKYSNMDVIIWDGKTKVDFVYCSNVVEHVHDVENLVNNLVKASKKWVCIQAPYNETWPDGSAITPDTPKGEHIRTIDDNFIRKFFAIGAFEETKLVIGKAPVAWPGGEQFYFLGKISDPQP